MTEQNQQQQQNNQQQNQEPNGGKPGEAKSAAPSTWDEALKGLPEDMQTLYSTHISGLRNTVQATRQERDELARQIKELLPKAEKGSELEKSLTEFSTKLAQSEQRAAFYEEAGRPEIGCRNPKAAFLLAQADNLFDRKGNPDWAAIKAEAPELFGAPSVTSNAGDGTSKKPTGQMTMNELIRRAAGRG
jgi:hypothetical protein